MRLLSEKLSDQPESHSDKEKMAEFSVPTWMVLNGLERMGYRVVTSSSMITGYGKHDTRDFIWTLHKVDMDTVSPEYNLYSACFQAKEDWEASSK